MGLVSAMFPTSSFHSDGGTWGPLEIVHSVHGRGQDRPASKATLQRQWN